MADKILYTSDGTNLIYVGANQVNMRISGTLTHPTGSQIIDSTGSQGTAYQVLTSNGSSNIYWSTVAIGNISGLGTNIANTLIIALGSNGSVLTSNGTATISAGFGIAPYNLGTASGTVTPAPANGNYQYITNNGAFTLAAPSADCAIDILLTNGVSAGSITFSGFTVGTLTGSALTTTSGNKFIISIRRINSVTTYIIYALQ